MNRSTAQAPQEYPGQGRLRPRARLVAAVLVALFNLCWPGAVTAQTATGTPALRELTFEELANVTVTTVSRREENAFQVPAAMHVLLRDSVLNTGALVLPEALREVPGLNVAQINASSWAIGARGFQWQYANKLLVMIDGRSIYSPISGGVRWEDNPVFLEDLDRVEVVDGPGSSMWGSNAVNGVINIVSRSAFDTVGATVFGGTGGNLEALAGARQGFRLSDTMAVRLYGQYQESRDNILSDGSSADDAYRLGFGGMRLDWLPKSGDQVTFQLGAHDRTAGYMRTIPDLNRSPAYTVPIDGEVHGSGQHATVDWVHETTAGSHFHVSAYWSHTKLDWPQYLENLDTTNIEAVWTGPEFHGNRFTAGLDYRLLQVDLEDRVISFSSPHSTHQLYSGFVQDEITLRPDELKLSLGTKIEHQESTGWNLQPTARLAWTPRSDWTVWTSVAQAVRAPTLVERSVQLDAAILPPGVFDPQLPAVIRVEGNSDLDDETLVAGEAGVRWKSSAGWSVDLAAFTYRYTDYVIATGNEVSINAVPPALVLGQQFQNGINGESYGGELTLRWEPLPGWRLGASGNFLRVQLHAQGNDPLGYEQDEDTTPRASFMLTSDWSKGPWSLHLAGRQVGAIKYYDIPAYAELDLRFAWKITPSWELSVVGRNLLDASHPEYDTALFRHLTELRRTVSLFCQWRY